MAIKVDPKKLIEAGAHFGHQTKRWNPKMEKYLYGSDSGVHIFDLIKTQKALEEVLELLSTSSKEGKSVLILGTKKQIKSMVAESAIKAGCYYVNERWLGGTLSNFGQIKKSLDKMSDMKQKKATNYYSQFTKRERGLIDIEITRLERFFGGLNGLNTIPDVIFIIDIKKEKGAALEAKRMGVTTIGIVDSNSDPDLVDYAIPMNDDATKALEYVLELVAQALLEGKKGIKNAKS